MYTSFKPSSNVSSYFLVQGSLINKTLMQDENQFWDGLKGTNLRKKRRIGVFLTFSWSLRPRGFKIVITCEIHDGNWWCFDWGWWWHERERERESLRGREMCFYWLLFSISVWYERKREERNKNTETNVCIWINISPNICIGVRVFISLVSFSLLPNKWNGWSVFWSLYYLITCSYV
jgi:hypothetical protein